MKHCLILAYEEISMSPPARGRGLKLLGALLFYAVVSRPLRGGVD